jgi:hypothetical protein
MVMGTPHQSSTLRVLTKAVKNHATSRNATVNQSLSTLLSQNNLRQVTVSDSRRYGYVLDFTEATPNAFVKATDDTTSTPNRPTANKTDRTGRIVTEHMLMASNHLARTIQVANMLSHVSINIVAYQETNPTTTKI